jgi:hypothetical protein
MTVGELKEILSRYEDSVRVFVAEPTSDEVDRMTFEIESTYDDEIGPQEMGLVIAAGEELPPL